MTARDKRKDKRTVQLSSYDTLLVTRERGRSVALDLPKNGEVILDFEGVEVASPSFLDELIKGAMRRGLSLTIVNANPRTRTNLLRLLRVNKAEASLSA